jgi:hypothetical protein
LEVFDAFREVGEQGDVFACDGVEGSIIYDISQFIRILFRHHKRRESVG